jgi:DNA-binding CsgD family transcriptional regulator
MLADGAARLTAGRLSLPGVPGLAAALERATRPRDTWPPPMGADLPAPDLSVRVAPWCGGDSLLAGPTLALVILRRREAETSAAAPLARRFGLTAAEARLAADLAGGSTLPVAASRACIRLTTARTHLQRVFERTCVRSQVALVALLRPGDWPAPLP